MKRIGILCSNASDGTSWWRAYGPLSHLSRQLAKAGHQVNFERLICDPEVGFKWNDFSFLDAVFMQRPYSENHFNIACMAKSNGCKLWLDYDDNLFDIPYSNPACKTYSDPKVKANITKILKLGDLVTVSTHELRERYKAMSDKIQVVPNALDESRIEPPKQDKKKDKIICWRGSRTHDEDLNDYLDPIVRLATENKEWRWMFLGVPTYEVQKRMPANRTLILEGVHIASYFQFMNDFNCEIGIVPLSDNTFNRCKSNIAYLEFSYCGAATLAPQWLEWKNIGCSYYNNQDEFYKSLKRLMQDTALRQDSALTAQNNVMQSYTLETVNKIRFDAVMKLIF